MTQYSDHDTSWPAIYDRNQPLIISGGVVAVAVSLLFAFNPMASLVEHDFQNDQAEASALVADQTSKTCTEVTEVSDIVQANGVRYTTTRHVCP